MVKISRKHKQDPNRNLFQQDSNSRREQRIQRNKRKRDQFLDEKDKHSYETLSHGMVDFPSEYIQHIKNTYPKRSYLQKPEYKCKYCDAIFWFNEKNTKCNNPEVTYSNCCKNGKIKIPKFREPPAYLKNLLNPKGDKICRHFLQKIRQYNSMFAFTSMGGNIDKRINQREGPYVFRINGHVHHQIE